MTAVGSRPARSSISATIDVVVVLPCAPAIAMPTRSRISSASISARGITGTCRARASTTSGLSAAIADETTTTSASPTCRASCPIATRTPSDGEPVGDLRSLRVRSADAIAEIHQQLGDAAHADAADPDEVHASRPSEPHHHAPAPLAHAGQLQHAIDDPRGRVGPARTCASRAPSRASRLGIGEQLGHDARQRRAGQRRARRTIAAAPALDEHLRRSCAGGRRSPPETARAPPAARPPPARRASSRPRGRSRDRPPSSRGRRDRERPPPAPRRPPRP